MVSTLDRRKLVSLNLPDQISLQVTPEQFAQLAIANRDLRLERTATGVLIVNPPTGGETGKRNLNLAGQLSYWFEANDNLGEAFDSSTGFELPNGANRSPDASWVARERWESLTQEEREGFIPLCPDFVVELRSKTDSLKKLQEKMEEYVENGAKLGWLIDPQNKRVEIYRPGQAVEVLQNPDTLSGEEILPGFTLSLKRIFPV
ncbi:Uma2 family endonuclease [Synechocystis salina]|uniref:Uma2 family endonuclease n=1 Tax=Synechocystis salina LEGE 00031 TaxID=1828736 RepID=A0ABR9VS26_9SYNC|nr:Uma2 family endonuclease [Synechocystis salina]MBE9241676.1 Uma2 family endonuclease [Synechocystis salina LEGE 00041]MBE9254130.1 Uma2 family endonuclease [Synechocystis salina LEGE 00031]